MDAFGILPSWCRPFSERELRRYAVVFCSLIAFAFASTIPSGLCRSDLALITVPLTSIAAVMLVLRVAFSTRRTVTGLMLAGLASVPIGYATSIVAALLTGSAETAKGAVLVGWLYGGISGLLLLGAFAPIIVHARILLRVRPVDAGARMLFAWGAYVAVGGAALLALMIMSLTPYNVARMAMIGATPLMVTIAATVCAIRGAIRVFTLRAWIGRVASGRALGLRMVQASDLPAESLLHAPRATLRSAAQHGIVAVHEGTPYRANPEALIVLV